MNAEELRTASEHLRETVSLKAGKWDDSMLADVLRECASLCEEEFYRSLQRCKAELRFPIVPADVTDRCPSLQVQSADEAWTSIGGKSEADTVIWTDLAAAAWGEVAQEPDDTARRMAFRKVYERIASGWKTAGRKPRVQVSLGTDQARRIETIKRAVAEKRLSVGEGRDLLGLPPVGVGGQKLLPEPPKAVTAQVSLTEEDIAYLTKLSDPRERYNPTEVEVRAKLGPYANEKFRLFLAPAAKRYEAGCTDCGCEIEDDLLRCLPCASKHAANRSEHARQAEIQKEREHAALARMWAATK
jgi:hypothetical protein